MNTVRLLIAGIAVGFISQAAFAFQETGGTGSGASAPSAPTAGISTTEPAATAKGLDIKIPGLGTIGSLPKLDFGLEILYGASAAPERPALRDDKSDGNLQIRGTLKYPFPR